MKPKRLIKFQLPVEIAIKLEVQALKQNMSLNEFCRELVSSHESNYVRERIDRIHDMLSNLHHDYFEVEEDE